MAGGEVLAAAGGAELSPLDALRSLTDPATLTADAVRAALDSLDPNSPTPLLEANEVLDFASIGARLHPQDEVWACLTEEAIDIYRRNEILTQ